MYKALSLAVDFGLVVLIWLVQLIIYPSFGKIEFADFISWHRSYMFLISLVVAPLMLIQLGLSIYGLIKYPGLDQGIRLALILSVWLLTFLISVPLHNALGKEGNTHELVKRLVETNWLRTIGWSVILIINAYGILRLKDPAA